MENYLTSYIDEEVENDGECEDGAPPPQKKNKGDDNNEQSKRVDGEHDVNDVLLYMDKHKVEQMTARLSAINFIARDRQIPGVNYVRTPDNLKQLVEANKKKSYPAGKFLSYFMDFLYASPSRNIDSPFLPIPEEKMAEILDVCELTVPRPGKKDALLLKCKSMQFAYRNLNYSIVLSCKINNETSGAPNQQTIEIVNSDNLRPRIDMIIDRSIKKLERMRASWRQVLRAKIAEHDGDRPMSYSDAVKSAKDELRGPLITIGQHQLFDEFMDNDENIERGSLYVSPTTGFVNSANAFTCLELVDVEGEEGTFLSKIDAKTLGNDLLVYACVRYFKLCYTSNHGCYLKGYVQWALKQD